MTDLQYPIGRVKFEENLTDERRAEFIATIEATPARLRAAVAGLTAAQLDTPYRPDGWTVRQVVHHLPDSHLNSYVRFKLALTETDPTIKTYDEGAWAQLADGQQGPIEISLDLLEALHQRWVLLLRSLEPADFKRTFKHPELGLISLEKNLSLYAWHGPHHMAQITGLRQRLNWD